jgi:hypothetical protein
MTSATVKLQRLPLHCLVLPNLFGVCIACQLRKHFDISTRGEDDLKYSISRLYDKLVRIARDTSFVIVVATQYHTDSVISQKLIRTV